MPEYRWPEHFNSTYDCMMFGYEESINKMQEIGRAEVNKHGIYVRFVCSPLDTIWQYGKIMLWQDIFSPFTYSVFFPLLVNGVGVSLFHINSNKIIGP